MEVRKYATLSPCGKYRWTLERDWSEEFVCKTYGFIGVNPSTADAEEDDATIRKMIGFAKRWGGQRILVVNLFDFRATDVNALAYETEPESELNRYAIEQMAITDAIVACWGDVAKLPSDLRPQARKVYDKVRRYSAPLLCIGTTKNGSPRHPLMLPYSTPLRDFTME